MTGRQDSQHQGEREEIRDVVGGSGSGERTTWHEKAQAVENS